LIFHVECYVAIYLLTSSPEFSLKITFFIDNSVIY
jgi:hypothetical protein